MERICYTGIKLLGRQFKVTRSGAILLLQQNGRLPEIVWWPPIELSKEIYENYRDCVYYIDDEGYLVRKWDPPELYMDVWDF